MGAFYGYDDSCHCIASPNINCVISNHDTVVYSVKECYEDSDCGTGKACLSNKCESKTTSCSYKDTDWTTSGSVQTKVAGSYNSSSGSCVYTTYVRCSSAYYSSAGISETSSSSSTVATLTSKLGCAKCPSYSSSVAGSDSIADCLCNSGYYMSSNTCQRCPAFGQSESCYDIVYQVFNDYFGWNDTDRYDNDGIDTLDDYGPGVDDFEDLVNEIGVLFKGEEDLCGHLDCRENYTGYTMISLIEVIDSYFGVGTQYGLSPQGSAAISKCFIPVGNYVNDIGAFTITSPCGY